jgi:hypothetical protein
MSESSTPAPAAEKFDAPPLSPMPVQSPADAARSRLHQLAEELSRSHNRRLLIEYLQVRRAVR